MNINILIACIAIFISGFMLGDLVRFEKQNKILLKQSKKLK